MPKRWEELEKKLGPEREARIGRRTEQGLGAAQADDDPRSFVGSSRKRPRACLSLRTTTTISTSDVLGRHSSVALAHVRRP